MPRDGAFDEDIAARYDRDHGRGDAALISETVNVLSEFAGEGPALEFAVGTGRVALPLYRRGVRMHGIEQSCAMVAEMRKKPDGNRIEVTVGDMATTQVGMQFPLVFLVFNTIQNLTSQAAQVACFRNAAAHLKPGGFFLVETELPPLCRMMPGEKIHEYSQADNHWGLDEIDRSTQCYSSNHVWVDGEECTRLTIPFRYVWPSELDLMAQLAGLRYVQRWGSWKREAFTADSIGHVSIWQKPLDPPRKR